MEMIYYYYYYYFNRFYWYAKTDLSKLNALSLSLYIYIYIYIYIYLYNNTHSHISKNGVYKNIRSDLTKAAVSNICPADKSYEN